MSNISEAVLQLLKGGSLLSAMQIEKQLGLAPRPDQGEVRYAIGVLRAQGEPIWNQTGKGFFWRNDLPAPAVGDRAWKRRY